MTPTNTIRMIRIRTIRKIRKIRIRIRMTKILTGRLLKNKKIVRIKIRKIRDIRIRIRIRMIKNFTPLGHI